MRADPWGPAGGRTRLTAALALAAAAACGEAPAAPRLVATAPAADAGVPRVVLGAWRSGPISTLTFWDDQSRSWPQSGVALMFTFEPDGRYVARLYAIGRNLGCVQQVWHEVLGTAAFGASTAAGGTFATRATEGRRRVTDTCVARNNVDRAMSADELAGESRAYVWGTETGPGGGITLAIARADGDPVYFGR